METEYVSSIKHDLEEIFQQVDPSHVKQSSFPLANSLESVNSIPIHLNSANSY